MSVVDDVRFWLAVVATVLALPAAAAADPPTPPGSDPASERFDSREFERPTSQDRPNAFWFWNGALTEDELERQLLEMRAGGVEEFFIHPRQGLGGGFGQTENDYYLSRDYFDKVGFVLGRARQLGMHAWLYDDLNWPSGYAGGRVLRGGDVDGRTVEANPEHIARYLRLTPRQVEGSVDEPVPTTSGAGWFTEDGELVTNGGEVGLTRAGADWRDYRMSFDATIENIAVGWTLRARDPGNLIMVNLTATSPHNPEAASTFGVHVRQNGGYRLIGGRIPAGVTIEPGTRYAIETEITGSTLRLTLDGRHVATVSDPAFAELATGRVGFRSDGGGGERARIDDLRVTQGAETLFADDFESGDLSSYDAALAARAELIAALAARTDGGCDPGGRLDGASTIELTDRVQQDRLRWDAPPGRWCLLFLTQHELTNYHPDLEPEERYVDMLSPAATRKFIDVTHEVYARRFGPHFGRTIRGIFNDEPGFYNNFPDGRGGAETRGSIPWTPGFRAYLKRNIGYDVTKQLPALWYDAGANTTKVRVDYYDALQDRYNEAHTKPLYDWAADHDISLISNPLVEESLGDHKLIEGGDWFEMSRWYQIPGMDLIGGLNVDEITPKLNSSVAHAFDRGRNLAESFGAFGWDLTLEEMKRGIAWEASGGVDLTDNHAFYYSIEGGRRHESPPSEFFQNLFWPHFPKYAETVGRLNQPARGSTPVNRVALLYPTSTLFAEGTPYSNRGFFGNGPELGPINDSFKASSAALLREQLDFDYLSELKLAGDADVGTPARADDGRIELHDREYEMLVWPRTTTLSLDALRTVERFVAGGGALVAVEALPTKEAQGRDGELQARIERLFERDRAVFLPSRDELAETVRALAEPDVMLEPATPAVRVRHVRRDGEHAFLLVNTAGDRVRTEARLARNGVPELWWPETGDSDPAVAYRHDRGRTIVPLTLEPYESVWVVFRPRTRAGAHVTAASTRIERIDDDEARAVVERPGDHYVVAEERGRTYGAGFTVDDPLEPVALGGTWEIALGNGPPITRPLGSWTALDPGYSGRATYTRRFDLEPGFLAEGRRIQLELGAVDEIAEVRLNGRPAGDRVWAPYRLDVTDRLQPGENTLEVTVTNTQSNAFEGRALSSGLIGPVRLRPERVVDVELERNRIPTQHRVPLGAQSSPLTGLRLDPLRSAGEIHIESIRVLP